MPTHLAPLLALVCAMYPSVVAAPCGQEQPPVWRWADIELMGHRSATRDAILAHIPLEIGSEYEVDREAWAAWAEALEAEFGFAEVKISAVRYVDRRAFLVVDVIEKSEEARAAFRDPPDGDVDLPEDVLEVYDKMRDVLGELFSRGTPPRESADDGFLDYDHPETHELVLRLHEITPPHRETLIEAIRSDADASTRATAATLLNWAGDTTRSTLEILPLLDDPDHAVRNNLTRFMLHYFERIESVETRRRIIDALVPQLSWPSHADRNKAISALYMFADSFPADRAYIREEAGEAIQYLAEHSILSNVGGTAKEVLAMIEPPSARPDEDDQSPPSDPAS